MTEFLQGEGEKQVEWNVGLKEVMASASIAELIGRVARRAVHNATRRPTGRVLRRVERVTKHTLPQDLVTRVAELDKLRNQVVHDMKTFNLGREQVVAQFHLLIDLLKELGKASQQADVPIEDASGLVIRRPFSYPPDDLQAADS